MPKLPFLKIDDKSLFSRDWLLLEDDQGCTPVKSGLCLLMEKSPRALPQPAAISASTAEVTAPATTPKPSAPPPPPKKDSAVAFLEWMIERGEKKPQKNQPPEKPRVPKPPKPFDLYDLPAYMRNAGFPNAAKLNQRWLDGRVYTSIDTNGKEGRYDKDMVDMKTISLSWLRGYEKVEKRYQALLGKLSTTAAQKALLEKFTDYLTDY